MRALNARISQLLEIVVSICVASAVMVVLWGVFSRFIVSVPSRWTEELATILLTWIAVIGAALAFRHQQHLGVDYLYSKLHPDAQRLNLIIVYLLIMLFALCVLVWGGASLVLATFGSGQITAALGVRSGYIYLALPISGVAIALFSLEQLLSVMWHSSSTASRAADSALCTSTTQAQ